MLLVDDSLVLLTHLTELLPEFGVHIAAAVDRGERAVPAIAAARAAGTPVDVVVMDVRMPGIGGLEATRQVRAAYPDIQVILYTAYGGHLDEQARQVGAFAEIAKGTGLRELVDTIWAGYRAARA